MGHPLVTKGKKQLINNKDLLFALFLVEWFLTNNLRTVNTVWQDEI